MRNSVAICAVLLAVLALTKAYPLEDEEALVEESQANLMDQGFFDSQLAEMDDERQREIMGLADDPFANSDSESEDSTGGKKKKSKGGGKGNRKGGKRRSTTTESP